MHICIVQAMTWLSVPEQKSHWIRIQGFDDQNFKKGNTVWNNYWPKIANYLSRGHRKGRPKRRRSLQPSKEDMQHFKKLNLLTFYIFVGNFCPPGTGSVTGLRIRIQSGSGSGFTTLVQGVEHFFSGTHRSRTKKHCAVDFHKCVKVHTVLPLFILVHVY